MRISTCRASHDERTRRMVADRIVPEPMATITNAVTIDAPPGDVWPWLAQMGAGRAGWYSYDHVDNGGVPSARRILLDYQRLAPGDLMPAIPGTKDAFVVSSVDPPRSLVLTVPVTAGSSRVSVEYSVEPLDRGRSRLIVRGRVSPHWLDAGPDESRSATSEGPILIERVYSLMGKMPRPLLLLVARFGRRLMQARQLRNIKRRAEAGQMC